MSASAAVLDAEPADPKVEGRLAISSERRLWRALRRPVVAAGVLAAVYAVLGLAMAPAGEVADVGGKLASLHVMDERGSWNPDVGYWAATDDAQGALHPLRFTNRVGDEWVQVTTLPMLYAALPLHRLGGDRAVLALPIAGAIACAFAARALARRLGGGNGWTAYWAVGLLTPVAVYALSFWEHTIGLALMTWAVVALLDVHRGRGSTSRALLGGALFGFAAALRTEALVYGATTIFVVCGAIALARRFRSAWSTGIAALAGLVGVIGANQMFEQLVLGTARRGARVVDTAEGAGASLAKRLDLATTTATGINGFTVSIDWVVGAAAVAFLVAGVLLLRRRDRHVLAAGCLALAATLYVLRFSDGLGFVPGLLVASPLTAVGVVTLWRRPGLRLVGVLACAPVPLVWATQYADTMRPQWGSRYLLTTGLLLAVGAVVALRGSRGALAAAICAGALITASGVVFAVERSHSIADGTARVLASAPALVSMDPHFFRETGARYDPHAHWLTAVDTDQLERAAAVLADAGDDRLAVVAPTSVTLPVRLGPYRAAPRDTRVTTRPGEVLRVREYHVA